MLSDYQRQLRDRFLAAPVAPAPLPWRPVLDRRTPVGGLQGIGFAVHPENSHDLVMVVSIDGHGLFDAVTGEKIARERDPDPDTETPDASPDLACPGLGPVAGTQIRIAGLWGGGSSRDHSRRLVPERGRTGMAERAHPAVRERRRLPEPAGPGVVARVPLRLLHLPRRRVLPVRPHPGRCHQQRPDPVDP